MSPFDPQKHHRRSIRLKGYDYSQAGAYFVTMVTQGRACLFGDVVNGVVVLNDLGKIVQKWWDDLPIHFPNIETGAFVVMPNHVHGVIIIVHDGRGAVPAPGFDLHATPGREPRPYKTTDFGANCGVFQIPIYQRDKRAGWDRGYHQHLAAQLLRTHRP